MITCTSERSGMASSGVFSMLYTPQALIMTVAISTRKRLWMDQRMSAAIIAAPPLPDPLPRGERGHYLLRLRVLPPPPHRERRLHSVAHRVLLLLAHRERELQLPPPLWGRPVLSPVEGAGERGPCATMRRAGWLRNQSKIAPRPRLADPLAAPCGFQSCLRPHLRSSPPAGGNAPALRRR